MKLFGKTNRWQPSEREFLKRHYKTMNIKELTEKLKRSEESIHSQVAYLRKRGWTF